MFAKKEKPEKTQSFLTRLRARINRGDNWLTYDLANLAPGGTITEDVLGELETLLVMADVGMDTAERVIGDLQQRLARKELKDIDALRSGLEKSLLSILEPVEKALEIRTSDTPFVILMVGVNGAGKTTTIGKLARRFQDDGYSVMLAAGDTFRAAAIEQLQIWGERTGCPVVVARPGADAAGLVYDALERARAEGMDVLLIDTAGRLHNKKDLMDELRKIVRAMRKVDARAPHDCVLVMDATVGQNAHSQVETFRDMVDVSGLVVAKLDGSAKGGRFPASTF